MEKIYNGIISNKTISNDIMAESIIFNDKTIIGFNEEIAVNYPFKTGLKGAVRLTELYKLLQKIKDETVTFLIEKEEDKEEITGGELIIEAGNIDAGFPLIKDYVIPDIEVVDLDSWESLPDNFIDGIQFCLFSASSDISDGILVTLEISEDHIRSTDNYRLTEYNLNSNIKTSFLLHQRFVKAIATHNPIKVAQDDSWLHFCDNKDNILSVRKLSEAYPEIDEFFNIEEIEKITLPSSLKDTLNRTRILASDDFDNEVVIITINKDETICECQGKYGWIIETTKDKAEYKGKKKELKFIAVPEHLLQILDEVKTVTIGEGRLLFESDNFKHIIVTLPDAEL